MQILFNPDKHKYYLEGTNKTFESVSRILDTIKPKFASNDKEHLEKATAYFEKYKDRDKKPEKWNKDWKSGEDVSKTWKVINKFITERGNRYHKIYEDELLLKGAYGHRSNFGGDKMGYSLDYLKNLPIGIHLELIVPNFNTWSIGQADKIEILEDKWFSIEDHKGVSDLQVIPVAYYKPELGYKEFEYLYAPVSHLVNTKFNGYQLQLSMYSLFLEALGYKFRSGKINHIIFEGESDKVLRIDEYPITYLKEECKNILNSWRLNNSIRV